MEKQPAHNGAVLRQGSQFGAQTVITDGLTNNVEPDEYFTKLRVGLFLSPFRFVSSRLVCFNQLLLTFLTRNARESVVGFSEYVPPTTPEVPTATKNKKSPSKQFEFQRIVPVPIICTKIQIEGASQGIVYRSLTCIFCQHRLLGAVRYTP